MITTIELSEHKQRVAAVYNLAAPGYDKPAVQFFPRIANHLVSFTPLQPGQRVLDVATGTGVAALAAARTVGLSGQVVGVDIAQEMLTQARSNVADTGLFNIELHHGDAERLPFDEHSFDVVVAASALFFLPDMRAGLLEWKRVVKPGGWVAFSGYGATAFEPLSSLFAARIREYGVKLPASPHPFSWQRLTDPAHCADLLHQAGCENVKVQTVQLGYYLPTAADWWDIVWGSGFRGPVAQLGGKQLRQFKAEHLAEVATLTTPRGIWLDIAAIVARGQKPTSF